MFTDFETITVLIVMALAAVSIVFAIFSKTWRKILAGIFAVAAIIYGGFAARNALAENATFDNFDIKKVVKVEAAEDEEGPCLRISFIYHGNVLSWYDNEYLPQCRYQVLVFNKNEVLDANIILSKILPLR